MKARKLLFTNHGQIRMQQRAIPQKVINWLLLFGKRIYQRENTSIIYFTKHIRNNLRKLLTSLECTLLDKKANAYLVINGYESIITVGYRNRRLY